MLCDIENEKRLLLLLFILFFMCLFLKIWLNTFFVRPIIYRIVGSRVWKNLCSFLDQLLIQSLHSPGWVPLPPPRHHLTVWHAPVSEQTISSLAGAGEFPSVLAFHPKGLLIVDRSRSHVRKSRDQVQEQSWLWVCEGENEHTRTIPPALPLPFLLCLTIFVLTWLPLTSFYQRLNGIVSADCH